ncbi:MAG: hypothetical protein C0524_05840 [Rhodobacter sp.]|nr:hypothetical protein [Rhodobacter sp.]
MLQGCNQSSNSRSTGHDRRSPPDSRRCRALQAGAGPGPFEEALGCFDTAIALAPGFRRAYRNKMSALADLGRFEEVVALGDEALRPGTIPSSNPRIEEDILSRRLLALASCTPM